MTGESRTPAPTPAQKMVLKHAICLNIHMAGDGKPAYRCRECQLSWRGTRADHPADEECAVWAALSRESASPQTDHGAARTKLREWLAEDGAVAEGDAAAPAMSWRCFHCDEVFTEYSEALDHFGTDLIRSAACRVAAGDGGLVKALRELERENASLRHENETLENDARLWHEANADRGRRIGNRQWWQELDYREGEKLALEARLRVLEQAHERLRERLHEWCARQPRHGHSEKCVWQVFYGENLCSCGLREVLASLPAPEVKPHE